MSQSEVEVGEQFDTVLDQRDSAEGFMRSMVVVAVQPVGRHVSNLLQGIEHVAVQHLSAVGLVESLDIGVLCWLARLDVLQGDAFALRPLGWTQTQLRP